MSPEGYFECCLLILLLRLVNGLNVDPLDYIPTGVDCTTPSDKQDSDAVISWDLDHSLMRNVRSFEVIFNCAVSGHDEHRKITNCNSPPCSTPLSLNDGSCYDKCHCGVRPVLRGLSSPTVNWSNVTCDIGPSVAPKASPMIISHPARKGDGDMIEVIFKLPAESMYCDSTDVITSVTVNVTEPINGSHQYTYNQSRVTHTSEQGCYKFTLQVDHHQFWRPFNITISVNNSIGSSPFSDHVTVRGANNDDITSSDYSLNFTKLNSTLHFRWNLLQKAEDMMSSQFITGFNVTVRQLSNDTILATDLMESQNLTLNVTLEPNQWYLIIGRILTEDDDTWGPEPIYKYFQTPTLGSPECSSSSDNSSGNNSMLVALLILIIFLTVLVVTLLVCIARPHTSLGKLCLSDYEDDDVDSCTDKINEVIGPVAESYTEYRCDDPSTVENSDYYPKNQTDNIIDDLDSTISECNRHCPRSTAV